MEDAFTINPQAVSNQCTRTRISPKISSAPWSLRAFLFGRCLVSGLFFNPPLKAPFSDSHGDNIVGTITDEWQDAEGSK